MLLILVTTLSLPAIISGSILPVSQKEISRMNSLEGGDPLSPHFYETAQKLLATSKDFSNLTLEEIKHRIDSILEWEAPQEIAERFPYYLSGYDYEERPIWIIEAGKFDLKKAIETFPNATGAMEQIMIQAAIQVFKSMTRRPDGSNTEETKQYIGILDFDGFDILQVAHVPTVTFALKILRKYLDLMVIGLHQMIIINANYATEILVSILRPVMGSLFERFEIYGGNKGKWSGVLRRLYPAESYPPWYGGSGDWKPVKVYG